MKAKRLLLVCTLLITLLSVAFFVRAVCNPADTGTAGDDTITCDVANPPAADIQGVGGNDTIIIDSGVVTPNNVGGDNLGAASGSGSDVVINSGDVGSIYGDSLNGDGSGSDTIVNNGIVNIMGGDTQAGNGNGSDVIINNATATGAIVGDSFTGIASGSDSITNNGSINASVFGDAVSGDGSGNDVITNNGIVNFNIYGDTFSGDATGNDVLTNNGTIVGNLSGDSNNAAVNTGSDTINNGGSVNNIYGDDVAGTGMGNDTITNGGSVNGSIVAGGGADAVIIQTNTATVGGTIDGGTGYDVLTFNLTSTDPAVLLDAAAQIAAANPAGGTITLMGHTYTWTNFEELTQLLFSLARINGLMDPLAVFCALTGGVDVYAISGSQGILAVSIGSQQISNGVAAAVEGGSSVQIGGSSNATVYVTGAGEVQISGTGGFNFSFVYQNYCGTLPAANGEPFSAQVEEELPPFSIINQPYEG